MKSVLKILLVAVLMVLPRVLNVDLGPVTIEILPQKSCTAFAP